ncbi:MAG: response regulator [Gammaproteobacteria bacterium]|nr:response regulator [Gammaproteobacteria bacterium]
MSKLQIRTWLPSSLMSRLVASIGLLIAVVMLGFAAYTAQRDQQIVMSNITQQLQAMASQLDASSTNYLITENYAELEELVRRFMQTPSVSSITILDPFLDPLVAMSQNNGDIRLLSQNEIQILMVPDHESIPHRHGDSMVIWRNIEVGHSLGWVNIQYSLDNYQHRLQEVWVNSLLAVFLALLLSVFFLRPILRRNIDRLKQATEFAKQLSNGDGSQLRQDDLSTEIQDLVTALNRASTELHEGKREIKCSQSLLESIHLLQSGFIEQQDRHALFVEILERVLELTDSEFGFIGEVLQQANGQPYLKTHAISNIAWNQQTRELYEEKQATGLEFFNMDTLFGEVIRTATPLITNDPAHHPKSTGTPAGHPPLTAFMGIPYFNGTELVGVVALANRSGGYGLEHMEFLKPLLSTCGQVIGAYRDAEARLETEQRLKNSENMLRQVLNTIPTRVYWKDLDGVYQGCNYNFAQDAGFSGEVDVMGKNDYELPWSREASSYRHDDKEIIGSGIPRMKYEESQTTPSGEAIWLRSNKIPLRNTNEEVIGILGSYEDITTEKAHEQQLRDSEARLANAQRIAHLGHWEQNLATGEEIWSEETFRILGLDPDRHHARYDDFKATIHPDDREAFHDYVKAKSALKQAYQYELRLVLQGGVEKTVYISAEYELDSDGKILRTYGTLQDITERKRIEKMKDEFISTVSHELRTPLTSIMGSLGLVRNMLDSASPEKIENLLTIAHNNTERLLFLINDILDISKIESGRISFHFKPVDAVQLVNDAIANNESYNADIEFELVNPPANAVWVYADRDRLMQVITNLLSNAAKFSHPGGKVEVGISQIEDKVEIYVRDHGVGIPEAFRSSIFEKFTQADSSDTRHVGGTGLGLSISKTIIERHHGEIDFDSEVGKGTCFTITLPSHGLVIDSTKDDEVETGGPKVLICEDEPDIAQLMRQMLANEGYRCAIANTANQALALLKQDHFDAMTLDIMLPGMDGITFLRQLREQPEFDELEVIIVSVKADEARSELSGTALGIHDWLGKPIDESRLLAAMRHVVPSTRSDLPRILHVEDDPDLVQVVQSMLQETARVVAADSLVSARNSLDANEFDLILLDVNLPDGSGLELLEQLRRTDDTTPVVIFSSEDVDQSTLEQVQAVLQKTRVDNDRLLNTINELIGTDAGGRATTNP